MANEEKAGPDLPEDRRAVLAVVPLALDTASRLAEVLAGCLRVFDRTNGDEQVSVEVSPGPSGWSVKMVRWAWEPGTIALRSRNDFVRVSSSLAGAIELAEREARRLGWLP